MEDKKKEEKLEIAERLREQVDEEKINEVLKQVDETEKIAKLSLEVTKQVLELMRGKTHGDLSNSIIALMQISSIQSLSALRHVLDDMIIHKMIGNTQLYKK